MLFCNTIMLLSTLLSTLQLNTLMLLLTLQLNAMLLQLITLPTILSTHSAQLLVKRPFNINRLLSSLMLMETRRSQLTSGSTSSESINQRLTSTNLRLSSTTSTLTLTVLSPSKKFVMSTLRPMKRQFWMRMRHTLETPTAQTVTLRSS